MPGGDVDAQRQRQALAPQCGNAAQRFGKHPFPERNLQFRALQGRQKSARCQHPLLRVAPAHQALRTHHCAAVHVHLRLQVQRELTVLQRLAQPLDLDMLLALAARQDGVETVETVASVLLGLVHGLVSVAQQGVGVGVVLGVQGVANAGGDANALGLQRIGRRDVGHELPELLLAALARLQVGQQDDELVSTQACHAVRGAQRAGQPRGHDHQQAVARTVA